MKSMNRRKYNAQVAIEPLDRRVMLTGNVMVSLSAGELTVRGDNLENQIGISQPTPGTIRVQGLDGTKVNGRQSVDITGRTSDLSILMQQGGEDQVTVNGPLKLNGDVRATLKQGAFTLEGTKGPVEIGDDLTIRTGAEADVTISNAVHVTGETDIRAGGSVAIVAGRAAIADFHAATFSNSQTIDNPYFPLVPGTTYTYDVKGINQDTGEEYSEEIIFEVLSDTKTILGVKAVGLATGETVEVPAGTFQNVFRTRDTSIREPFGLSDKSCAPGLGTVREVKYDIETNEILQTAELVSVTLHGVPTTTLVDPTDFDGTNAAGNTAVGGVEFAEDVRISAKGSVVLSGAGLEDSTSITSGAEVAILDSVFSDSVWILAGDNVALRNVNAEDRISILGDVDTFVLDSDIDDLWIRQGDSDNTLTFEGSDIGRLSADGGRGTNLFEDRGDNVFGRVRLRRLL